MGYGVTQYEQDVAESRARETAEVTAFREAYTKELGLGWHGKGVQVAASTAGGVHVRQGSDAYGPLLYFTQAEWRAFTDGVRNGEFDLDEADHHLARKLAAELAETDTTVVPEP
jgi:hypothetical protein